MKQQTEAMTEGMAIQKAQSHIIHFEKAMKQIEEMNKEAERWAAANAARMIWAKAHTLHCEATSALLEHYPDAAPGILNMGGGER